jgi:hypothetical protein
MMGLLCDNIVAVQLLVNPQVHRCMIAIRKPGHTSDGILRVAQSHLVHSSFIRKPKVTPV